MPELPEVEALAAYLRERAVGHRVERIDVAAISALKTYDPPPSARRRPGDRSAPAGTASSSTSVLDGDLHLIVHLARAGWLHYRDAFPSTTAAQAGQGPDRAAGPARRRLRLRPHRGRHPEAAWPPTWCTDPAQVPGVARLGPDALAADRATFAARIRSRRGQLKGVLTDQEVLAGIGNAYSDEILHAAKLSPFAMTDKLTDEQMATLYEATQTGRDRRGRPVGRAEGGRAQGREALGLQVHARTGLPCPVCGDTVREVSFADSSLQYCPTCQTGGKPLADRRLSTLVR